MAAGLFESRTKAQEAVAAGLVSVDGRIVTKAGERVPPDAKLQAEAPYPWVSRGGLKLVAALDRFAFDPRDQICLDVGASTGGFTDVLLSRGARQVYAVDVGHDQLHPRVRDDNRVRDLSGTDARGLTAREIPEAPGMIVCDASFISLSLVLPAVLPLAAPAAMLIALVKPQFEAGIGGTRKGIVRDAAVREAACARISALVGDLGWRVRDTITSPVTGRDGNVEYLIGAVRP
ncbi:TlyA family RNA methyltransferase [Hyphomicrobiales bacterium BP6-180914]|uniref:TlyA family RNA methyltransferase n=1 Tax=Lichenifustis flavocetrariae TaxID=2949735 RepID=A0AA42CK39_9HYPH|nr:TlyA family RNA methyltransferase [Lichenifustis flavocetrariae]